MRTPTPQSDDIMSADIKIRSKSLYLVRFSRYSHFFIFHKNPRWPPKVAKIEIFPFGIGYSSGQKFARNRSISYGFRDIHTFIFCKYPRWPPSLTVFEIFTLFHFPLKSKMAAKSGEN